MGAFLRNFIFHDFWLKLFSLALAILIWKIIEPAAYPTNPNKEKSENSKSPLSLVRDAAFDQTAHFNVPILVTSSAADVHDFKVSPDTVEVTLRGAEDTLKKIQAGDIRAQVDLTGLEGASSLRKRIEVIPPIGVTLVEVNPPEADVIFPPKH